MSRARRLSLGALVVLAGALLLFGLKAKARSLKPAPALPAQVLSGRGVALHQLLGRPAFVIFWASWCEPCQREAPAVERYARSLGSRAALIGVDWSDNAGDARAFVRRYGWTFTSLRDADGGVGLRYGLTGLPTSFLLDAGGRIAMTLSGQQSEQSLARALRAL